MRALAVPWSLWRAWRRRETGEPAGFLATSSLALFRASNALLGRTSGARLPDQGRQFQIAQWIVQFACKNRSVVCSVLWSKRTRSVYAATISNDHRKATNGSRAADGEILDSGEVILGLCRSTPSSQYRIRQRASSHRIIIRNSLKSFHGRAPRVGRRVLPP